MKCFKVQRISPLVSFDVYIPSLASIASARPLSPRRQCLETETSIPTTPTTDFNANTIYKSVLLVLLSLDTYRWIVVGVEVWLCSVYVLDFTEEAAVNAIVIL